VDHSQTTSSDCTDTLSTNLIIVTRDGNDSEIPLTLLLGACQGTGQIEFEVAQHHNTGFQRNKERREMKRKFVNRKSGCL
jgi:hypothetical protein